MASNQSAESIGAHLAFLQSLWEKLGGEGWSHSPVHGYMLHVLMGIDGVYIYNSVCVALVNPVDSALRNSTEGPGAHKSQPGLQLLWWLPGPTRVISS